MKNASFDASCLNGKRVVVFVAHPGHELRLYHLLELTKPVVHVLTDGSGSRASNRTPSTTKILEATGSRQGSVYGRFPDTEVYRMMLEGDVNACRALVDEFADSIRDERAEVLIGDMMEGYNSSHDLCRIMIGAAVAKCRSEYSMNIENFDFPLMGLPGRYADVSGAVKIALDDEAFERKLDAANHYPELRHEVDAAIAQIGKAPFQVEVVRPIADTEGLEWPEAEPPYYETYGEKQVAAGIYKHVIRYREHVQPLARAVSRQPVA